MFDVLVAHDIRYFFIAGGNDSMDTANKVFAMARTKSYELIVMGLPKTVDNDLPVTDHCPGYGSVARWLAVSVRDAGLDTEAIYTSDTIKIVETMGRNAGWITASTALAKQEEKDAPHIILLPEIPFNRERFSPTSSGCMQSLATASLPVARDCGMKRRVPDRLLAVAGHRQVRA